MKNRFNNITSKEWLPFQKSWFIDDGCEKLYNEHIRFFIKYDDLDLAPSMYYYGNNLNEIILVAKKNGATLLEKIDAPIQYALFDLRSKISNILTIEEYKKFKFEIHSILKNVFNELVDRRFISIITQNLTLDGIYYPLAWDLAYSVSAIFSLKDEKIGCYENKNNSNFLNENYFVMNFRKDENSGSGFKNDKNELLLGAEGDGSSHLSKKWGIIKPPPRNKKEKLHPAKFPENLISEFINCFSEEGDNVFDPMSGTGSTQLAAIQNGRNGYGIELSEDFAKIAKERLSDYLKPEQIALFIDEKKDVQFKILNKDVREIEKEDFPEIDYIITSPPYWNMLNMKGAENQAKRKEDRLKVNYSDDENDFGNIDDYDEFVDDLVKLYYKIIEQLKPGGYLTIIVKNIKKKGKNYPFAWDLVRKLNSKLILLPEFYWLQDDINLAPYGYGNTFVSNTFHQYCLNFRKPS